MKTHPLFLVLLLVLSVSRVHASHPVTTFTLVAPCQPFGTHASIPNMPGCFSFSATNSGASDPNGYYSWNFGDGSTGVGTPIVHCYATSPVAKQYTVTVAYNSTLVCGTVPMQQSFTVAVAAAAPTGINDAGPATAQVNLFPNPATEQLTIRAARPVSMAVLSDQTGVELARRTFENQQLILPLDNYAEGMYLIKIIYSDASESNLKFFKK